MGAIWYRLRVLTVHIAYVIYSTLLWWKLIHIGKQTGHPEVDTTIAVGVWGVFYIIANGIFCFSALSGSPLKVLLCTWCHVPMLIFIGFNLPPYGFTLKHLYEASENKNILHWEATNHTCLAPLNIPMTDFILLQMVMPVLLVTFIIYPLPNRGYASSEYLAIAVEFMNAFDIMDMIGDVAYVEKYGISWVIIYYISLGMSAILIAFPIKIEQEDFVWPRNFVICSESELSINKLDRSVSMSSILNSSYVIETGEMRQRRVSIAPGIYANDDETIIKSNWIDPLPQSQDNSNSNHLTQSPDNSNSTNVTQSQAYSNSNHLTLSQANSNSNHLTLLQANSNSSNFKQIIVKERNDSKTNDNVFTEDPQRAILQTNQKDDDISSQLKSKKNKQIETKSSHNLSFDITDKVWGKILKVVLTVIFMDAMFAAIRFKIMLTENSADYGFNMFVKSVILAALHISYLLQHVKTLIVTKLQNVL